MSLVPHDPFKQLYKIRKEFDRLFSEFLVPTNIESPFGKIQVDVHETIDEIIAICNVPGLEKEEDVNIEVNHDQLIISGQVNQISEVEENKFYSKERYTGEFHRKITLPSPISEEDVKATYKNGVLDIRMKKINNAGKKRIDINFE